VVGHLRARIPAAARFWTGWAEPREGEQQALAWKGISYPFNLGEGEVIRAR